MMKKMILRILLIMLIIIGMYGVAHTIQAGNMSGYDTLTYLDYPQDGTKVKAKLEVNGWVMSEEPDVKVQILIDGKEIEEEIGRYYSGSVLSAITGYGGRETNSKPRYKVSIDTSKLADGNHTITIKAISPATGKILDTLQRNFVVGKYETLTHLDYPQQGSEIKAKLDVNGWVMSEDPNAEVEILIDGEKIEEEIGRYYSGSVLSTITGYGGRETNSKPRYKVSIDTSKLTDGNHTITIKIISPATGEILDTLQRNFAVGKYETLTHLDYPQEGTQVKTKLDLNGWVMSEDANAKVEILIDGGKIEEEIGRYYSGSVLSAITGYGGTETNSNPRYKVSIDTSRLLDGNHTITIKIISPATGEILDTLERKFIVGKYNTLTHLDYPQEGAKIKTKLEVNGWVMSEDPNAEVEILIDGEKIEEEIGRYYSGSVLSAITGYGGSETNSEPRYKVSIDISKLIDGNHTITVKVISPATGEILDTLQRNFVIRKYEGIIGLEYPTSSNFNEDIYIQGWEMSELDNSYIKIYLDGKDTQTSIERYKRDDILESIKQYGDETLNSTPGFRTTLDLSKYSQGTHTMEIKLFTKLDEQIASVSKKILIYTDRYFGIDVSKHQGDIDFESLSKTGIDFMIIRAGYGRDANQEDIKFQYNYSQAKKYGIPVGVYWYSYATTVEQAKLEAENCLKSIKGKEFELPIFFDIEDPSVELVDKQTQTNMCLAFAETIKAAGFDKVGIYASKYWIKDHLYIEQIPDSYAIWVASYGANNGEIPSSTYEYMGRHELWQYTSRGTIAGISGNVDMNVCYKKYW